MSFMGEACLDTPHFKVLRRKPMIRTRRNPSKRNLLLNIMPVSSDPGLSPSTRHLISPVNHQSSWSSASEAEQSPSCKSAHHGGKINQLLKVNEAIADELADLESGKERWLEKLKLLEARICSNLVNIDKWAAENKTKHVRIKAVDDAGYVGDVKVEGSPFSGSPSTWRLSLADLVSIFKGVKLEHSDRLPLEHLKDGAFFPFTDENLFYSGHEGSSPSSNKGNLTYDGANDSLKGCSTLKGSASMQGVSPVSSEKVCTPSKQAKVPVDISMKEGKKLPEYTSEAYGVGFSERILSTAGISSGVAGGNGSWNEKSSIPIDTNHAVEISSKPGNTTFTESISSSEIKPSSKAAYLPQKREQQSSRGSLVLNAESFPTDADKEPAARLGSETIKKGISDEEESSRNQETDECNRFSESSLQMAFMEGNEEQSHTASRQNTLHNGLSEAREEVEQLQQQPAFGQLGLHDELQKARQELQQLKQHALMLEKEKSELESTLSDCKQALENAKSDATALQMQKEQLQTMFSNLKTSSESARLALLKEKDDQGTKLLSTVKLLEEAQQSAIVLERQKFVLQNELNYSRDLLEKTQKELKMFKKENSALELESAGYKQAVKEAQQGSALLERQRDDLAVQLSEHKTNLEKIRQNCQMLEKVRDELQQDLAESKHTLEEVLQKRYLVEREKRDLEAAHESLTGDLEKSEQNVLMLENENAVLENVLTEFKHTLEEIQQQMVVLEGEKDDLEIELSESKHACKEAWQHAISLEEEKGALEIGSCEYKEVLVETEQHVLALQSALEGTLQRADALDHQVQRLRGEIKGLREINESLKALRIEQETKCRELERQREVLEAEMESFKSKKEAAEESMVKMNALHALAMEETKKEREALQQEHSLLKKESDNLQVLLEGATQRSIRLEADQKEMQERLKDAELSLQKVMQELDVSRAEHENEVAALKTENSANESKIQTFMEQLQAKCIELERLCEVENEVANLSKKLKDQESQLENATGELESMKAEIAARLIDLERERSAKEALFHELNTKDSRVKELEKDLIMVRAEQTGLRWAMKDEMVKKKELMQKVQDEQTRGKELEAALQLAKLERNGLLMDLENERMAKEAALEEMEAIKDYSEELERDLGKLQAEVPLMWNEENEEQAATLQALHEEQDRSRELEEAQVAWEDQQDVNEALTQELEQEQQQRMQLEEQLKMLRAEEEQVGAVLEEERLAMERLEKRLKAQEARCRELERALNFAQIEQDNMRMVLDEEAMSKRAVLQELEAQRNRCLELEQIKTMKGVTGVNADPVKENLSAQVAELLDKSRKLEQLLSSIQREGAGDEACSAVTQEVKELQSRIQDIESKLADAGYVISEEKGKNEDELLALLDESPMFELGAGSSEAHDDKQSNTSMDVARQTEEELRRLKESTEIFHRTLFDAHHTAISDVAGLLVELKALKRLLDEKTTVASAITDEKRKGSLSLPTAALSTSALAAIGLLAFLKYPKHAIT